MSVADAFDKTVLHFDEAEDAASADGPLGPRFDHSRLTEQQPAEGEFDDAEHRELPSLSFTMEMDFGALAAVDPPMPAVDDPGGEAEDGSYDHHHKMDLIDQPSSEQHSSEVDSGPSTVSERMFAMAAGEISLKQRAQASQMLVAAKGPSIVVSSMDESDTLKRSDSSSSSGSSSSSVGSTTDTMSSRQRAFLDDMEDVEVLLEDGNHDEDTPPDRGEGGVIQRESPTGVSPYSDTTTDMSPSSVGGTISAAPSSIREDRGSHNPYNESERDVLRAFREEARSSAAITGIIATSKSTHTTMKFGIDIDLDSDTSSEDGATKDKSDEHQKSGSLVPNHVSLVPAKSLLAVDDANLSPMVTPVAGAFTPVSTMSSTADSEYSSLPQFSVTGATQAGSRKFGDTFTAEEMSSMIRQSQLLTRTSEFYGVGRPMGMPTPEPKMDSMEISMSAILKGETDDDYSGQPMSGPATAEPSIESTGFLPKITFVEKPESPTASAAGSGLPIGRHSKISDIAITQEQRTSSKGRSAAGASSAGGSGIAATAAGMGASVAASADAEEAHHTIPDSELDSQQSAEPEPTVDSDLRETPIPRQTSLRPNLQNHPSFPSASQKRSGSNWRDAIQEQKDRSPRLRSKRIPSGASSPGVSLGASGSGSAYALVHAPPINEDKNAPIAAFGAGLVVVGSPGDESVNKGSFRRNPDLLQLASASQTYHGVDKDDGNDDDSGAGESTPPTEQLAGLVPLSKQAMVHSATHSDLRLSQQISERDAALAVQQESEAMLAKQKSNAEKEAEYEGGGEGDSREGGEGGEEGPQTDHRVLWIMGVTCSITWIYLFAQVYQFSQISTFKHRRLMAWSALAVFSWYFCVFNPVLYWNKIWRKSRDETVINMNTAVGPVNLTENVMKSRSTRVLSIEASPGPPPLSGPGSADFADDDLDGGLLDSSYATVLIKVDGACKGNTRALWLVWNLIWCSYMTWWLFFGPKDRGVDIKLGSSLFFIGYSSTLCMLSLAHLMEFNSGLFFVTAGVSFAAVATIMGGMAFYLKYQSSESDRIGNGVERVLIYLVVSVSVLIAVLFVAVLVKVCVAQRKDTQRKKMFDTIAMLSEVDPTKTLEAQMKRALDEEKKFQAIDAAHRGIDEDGFQQWDEQQFENARREMANRKKEGKSAMNLVTGLGGSAIGGVPLYQGAADYSDLYGTNMEWDMDILFDEYDVMWIEEDEEDQEYDMEMKLDENGFPIGGRFRGMSAAPEALRARSVSVQGRSPRSGNVNKKRRRKKKYTRFKVTEASCCCGFYKMPLPTFFTVMTSFSALTFWSIWVCLVFWWRFKAVTFSLGAFVAIACIWHPTYYSVKQFILSQTNHKVKLKDKVSFYAYQWSGYLIGIGTVCLVCYYWYLLLIEQRKDNQERDNQDNKGIRRLDHLLKKRVMLCEAIMLLVSVVAGCVWYFPMTGYLFFRVPVKFASSHLLGAIIAVVLPLLFIQNENGGDEGGESEGISTTSTMTPTISEEEDLERVFVAGFPFWTVDSLDNTTLVLTGLVGLSIFLATTGLSCTYYRQKRAVLTAQKHVIGSRTNTFKQRRQYEVRMGWFMFGVLGFAIADTVTDIALVVSEGLRSPVIRVLSVYVLIAQGLVQVLSVQSIVNGVIRELKTVSYIQYTKERIFGWFGRCAGCCDPCAFITFVIFAFFYYSFVITVSLLLGMSKLMSVRQVQECWMGCTVAEYRENLVRHEKRASMDANRIQHSSRSVELQAYDPDYNRDPAAPPGMRGLATSSASLGIGMDEPDYGGVPSPQQFVLGGRMRSDFDDEPPPDEHKFQYDHYNDQFVHIDHGPDEYAGDAGFADEFGAYPSQQPMYAPRGQSQRRLQRDNDDADSSDEEAEFVMNARVLPDDAPAMGHHNPHNNAYHADNELDDYQGNLQQNFNHSYIDEDNQNNNDNNEDEEEEEEESAVVIVDRTDTTDMVCIWKMYYFFDEQLAPECLQRVLVNTEVYNSYLLAELMCESAPQLILNLTDAYLSTRFGLSNRRSYIGAVSGFFSASLVLYHMIKIVYYVGYKNKDLKQFVL